MRAGQGGGAVRVDGRLSCSTSFSSDPRKKEDVNEYIGQV